MNQKIRVKVNKLDEVWANPRDIVIDDLNLGDYIDKVKNLEEDLAALRDDKDSEISVLSGQIRILEETLFEFIDDMQNFLGGNKDE